MENSFLYANRNICPDLLFSGSCECVVNKIFQNIDFCLPPLKKRKWQSPSMAGITIKKRKTKKEEARTKVRKETET